MGNPGWEAFVAAHLPGYLLPESAAGGLSEDEAAEFLEHLSGYPRTGALRLLRVASLLVPRREALERFILHELPAWEQRLPSRLEVQIRSYEGVFQGRLHVGRTLAEWNAGRRTRFVTHLRERRFTLAEAQLVCHVARRLHTILVELGQAGPDPDAGWAAPLLACEAPLRQLLLKSTLHRVPDLRPTALEECAARIGHDPCAELALAWHRALREGLDATEPRLLARIVARGALLPLRAATRFELAVLVRLLQAVWQHLGAREPGRWRLERRLLDARRREVAAFTRDDGTRLDLFYNQAHLPAGPCDRGAQHYLAQRGRLRPDITLTWTVPGRPPGAVIIEAKHSADPTYLVAGYHEAVLYRWEYAPHLRAWPKAILVTSSPLPGGPPGPEHDVIACDWERWVPEEVLAGLLADILPRTAASPGEEPPSAPLPDH
jgi:hypothetical protein